ncbi:hypothetical protein COU18_00050 [Candidatus Kaiserbacteria bacterium CG10_big_fil_rev_8_21_14_0_10_51_14]|uniref:Uncharacterized protein n=1 Tax=Candidatus Kaiserbacteria bacterium CG10_big_fil_rev_8_21_14_0_10_51_14 TaxID=1974610 RepID=A0A2H0UCQ6_9BACT|nr:MAG: hypothetical protein COU18_00050 [Candidatus Kaiserbacteria bacterium CG10_big_fil_rev_8_21_14_0_10_51_14]
MADIITLISQLLSDTSKWFPVNYGWAISLLIQSFIAYHVFFLSKRLSYRAKLEHSERIKRNVDEIKLGREIYLVNVKRRFKDYPSNKERLISGYSHIKAEMKVARFDGIEFFCGIKEIYRKPDGKLSLNKKHEQSATEKIKVFEVGVIPYEWIDYIDPRGDEHGYKPLFFCYYRGRRYWKNSLKKYLPFGYPYKEIIYYRESNVYRQYDPPDWKFTFVNEEVRND